MWLNCCLLSLFINIRKRIKTEKRWSNLGSLILSSFICKMTLYPVKNHCKYKPSFGESRKMILDDTSFKPNNVSITFGNIVFI